MPEELKKQAEELGIKVDGRWNEERPQQEIDKALAGEPSAPVPTISVKIKRDLWDHDGNRHRKGTELDMPVEDAMDAVEAGTVTRARKA